MKHAVAGAGGFDRESGARHAIERLLRGVGEDLRDYDALGELLERQFETALRHDAAGIERIGQLIVELVEPMERRRAERVELVGRLAGADGRMAAVVALAGSPRDRQLAAGWQRLRALAQHCKALNVRNCRLMTDQQAIMQRVLHGDERTYAPA